MRKIFLLLFVIMFASVFVSASLDTLGSFPSGEDVRLRQVCQDATYVNISSVTYPNGSVALSNVEMESFGSGEYNYTFTDTDTVGTYSFNGISDGCDKTFAVFFEITEGGVEMTEGRSFMAIGLLFILCCFFFTSLFFMFNNEDYKGKFALYWISHVFFVVINFVGWQIGVEGLLGGTALTGVFRILFYVSTVAVIPMIFLSLAWIFYIHAFNEHMQKLLDKGVDPETAFTMTNKRKGGWFNGK